MPGTPGVHVWSWIEIKQWNGISISHGRRALESFSEFTSNIKEALSYNIYDDMCVTEIKWDWERKGKASLASIGYGWPSWGCFHSQTESQRSTSTFIFTSTYGEVESREEIYRGLLRQHFKGEKLSQDKLISTKYQINFSCSVMLF